MAITQNDKVFVVNENINTAYGGVDTTGQFETLGDLKGYKSLVLGNITYSTEIECRTQTMDVEGYEITFDNENPTNGFDLEITESTWVQGGWQLVIFANYTWNYGSIFSAVLEESDLGNKTIKFKTYDPVAESFTACDGANLEIRIYPPLFR